MARDQITLDLLRSVPRNELVQIQRDQLHKPGFASVWVGDRMFHRSTEFGGEVVRLEEFYPDASGSNSWLATVTFSNGKTGVVRLANLFHVNPEIPYKRNGVRAWNFISSQAKVSA